jgi:hypothetical protein
MTKDARPCLGDADFAARVDGAIHSMVALAGALNNVKALLEHSGP